jgi:hypothetical protein
MHNEQIEQRGASIMDGLQRDRATYITGVQGVKDLFPEPISQGVVSIHPFHFDERANILYNLRAVRDSGSIFQIYEGHYVRLIVDGELMMSDTPMERISNRDFIDKAKGRVLIAGLGIGMIIRAIVNKPEVEEIVVIEKYRDVIDLVSPKIAHPKVKVIEADIFTYDMAKSEKFDTIYFDIWASINTDNLYEMKELHKRYRKNKRDKDTFMDSWMKKFLYNMKRRERNESYY